MAYEKRDGDIAVFKEKEKRNEKAPDWKGTALLDGIEYQVAFWQKSPTMLAGKIEIARKKQDDAATPRRVVDLDDEVPF
jgi:hypothetical protein